MALRHWLRTKTANYQYSLLVGLVLFIGIIIRVGRFAQLPPGFNQDEAASAYEAYALLTTGMDKWGNAWPAYFPAWGSGQNVLLAYLTIPAIKAFGLSIFSARLPLLLTGVLTLPLLHFSLRPLGRFAALLGTFWLAVLPWHFMLSRWALESNLVPFCMLLGCALVVQALNVQRRRWIIPSLLPFALSLYAYGTTVVVLPVLFPIVLVVFFGRIRAHSKAWLVAFGLFGVVALPFLLFFVENYLIHRNLPWTDALFFSTPLLPATRISQVASGSWLDIVQQNSQFLLAGFDDGTCYNMLPGFKPLLGLTIPAAVVGAVMGGWKMLRYRGQPPFSTRTSVLVVFGAWALASLSLFFSFELNINRFNHFYLPCLVLAVWAVTATIQNFKPTVSKAAVRVGLIALLGMESSLAIYNYFTVYPNGPIKSQFNNGLHEAFVAAGGLWGIGQIRITNSMPLPYVYTLFYVVYPPAKFQQEAQVRIENGEYRVSRFGQYRFSDEALDLAKPYGYLARKNEIQDTDKHRRSIIFTNDDWEVGVMQPIRP